MHARVIIADIARCILYAIIALLFPHCNIKLVVHMHDAFLQATYVYDKIIFQITLHSKPDLIHMYIVVFMCTSSISTRLADIKMEDFRGVVKLGMPCT